MTIKIEVKSFGVNGECYFYLYDLLPDRSVHDDKYDYEDPLWEAYDFLVGSRVSLEDV